MRGHDLTIYIYLTTQKLVLIKYTLNGISNSSVTGTVIHTYVYICLTVNSYLLSKIKFGFNFIIRKCTSNY